MGSPILRAKAELERRRRRARMQLHAFIRDPVGFAKWLGVEITREQECILNSIRDNVETNVQAAHGIGKTFIAAVAVLWWVFAVEGTAVTTAPTENQVKELLWSEIRKLYDANRTRLGGSRTILTLRKTETARAYGFTAREYSPDSFQGKHGDRLLIIQDEANGISQEIDDGAVACITGSRNRLLRIGNPVRVGTPFFKACSSSHIRIPVWSHPNVAWAYELCPDGIHRLKPDIAARILTGNKSDPILRQDLWDPDLPKDVIPGAVSISWIERVRQKKGEASSYWQSRVEGYFPADQPQSLVPRSLFYSARARWDVEREKWSKLAQMSAPRHGIDVGDGGDPSAVVTMRGPVLEFAVELTPHGDNRDVPRAAGWISQHYQQYANGIPGGQVGVDRTGVGAGVLGILKENGIPAWGAMFGAAATKEDGDPYPQFDNWKSQAFWELRQAFIDGEIAICPLGDEVEERLAQELAAICYDINRRGQTVIEPKEKTKKRLGRSPNLADALVICFMTPIMPESFDFASTQESFYEADYEQW